MSVRQTRGQVRETGDPSGLSSFGASGSSIPAKRPSTALVAPLATAGNSKRKGVISISSDEGGGNEIKPLAGPSVGAARTRRVTKRTPVTMNEYRKENEELRCELERFKLSNESSAQKIDRLCQRFEEAEHRIAEFENRLRCKDEELDSIKDQLSGNMSEKSVRSADRLAIESFAAWSDHTELIFCTHKMALVDTLRSSLQCQICLELISGPHILTGCGHEFCGLCIRNWLTRPGAEAHECPTCRKSIRTRPLRTYMLPSILEIVRNATPAELLNPAKGSTDGQGDAQNGENLWIGIDFEDEDEEWELEANESQDSTQGVLYGPPIDGAVGEEDHDNVGHDEVDEGAPPGEGDGQWVMPTPLPPLYERPPLEVRRPSLWDNLNADEKMLIRRGASRRMIEELSLQWTEVDGITGALGEHHYHFGWRIARDWRSAPADELEMIIQIVIIAKPERFYFNDAGCIIERIWESN